MAEDKYKVDKTKVPKRISLKDASGIHELSDERNYEFLNELFKRKEADALVKSVYDVNPVFQLMDKDLARDITMPPSMGGKIGIRGQYSPIISGDLYIDKLPPKGSRGTYVDERASSIPKEQHKKLIQNLIDFYPQLIFDANFLGGGDLKKVKPSLDKKDIVAIYDQWNSPRGIETLLHEFRHMALKKNPETKEKFDDSYFNKQLNKDLETADLRTNKGKGASGNEIFSRIMDIYYENNAAQAHKYLDNISEKLSEKFEYSPEKIKKNLMNMGSKLVKEIESSLETK